MWLEVVGVVNRVWGVWCAVLGVLDGADVSGDGLEIAEDWTVCVWDRELSRLACLERGVWLRSAAPSSNIANGLCSSFISLVNL